MPLLHDDTRGRIAEIFDSATLINEICSYIKICTALTNIQFSHVTSDYSVFIADILNKPCYVGNNPFRACRSNQVCTHMKVSSLPLRVSL